jgi:hypothetical protein
VSLVTHPFWSFPWSLFGKIWKFISHINHFATIRPQNGEQGQRKGRTDWPAPSACDEAADGLQAIF